VLLDWGTNDWNPQGFEQCQGDPESPDCVMFDNLHQAIETVKEAKALPCLATLTPTITGRQPAQRYDWVLKANQHIRTLAQQDGALLVDIGDAFIKTGRPGDYILDDGIHPNDLGYALMADTFFKAITTGTVSGSSTSRLRR
jgi:lysophospholipase L1-like esterase